MLFLVQEQLKKETGSEDILSLSFGRIEIVSHYHKKKKKKALKKKRWKVKPSFHPGVTGSSLFFQYMNRILSQGWKERQNCKG